MLYQWRKLRAFCLIWRKIMGMTQHILPCCTCWRKGHFYVHFMTCCQVALHPIFYDHENKFSSNDLITNTSLGPWLSLNLWEITKWMTVKHLILRLPVVLWRIASGGFQVTGKLMWRQHTKKRRQNQFKISGIGLFFVTQKKDLRAPNVPCVRCLRCSSIIIEPPQDTRLMTEGQHNVFNLSPCFAKKHT